MGIFRRKPFQRALKALETGEKRLNSLYGEGNTLLYLAILENHLETVEALLEKGARTDIKNDWGMTPLDLATLLNRKKCVSLLRKKPDLKTLLVFRNADKKTHLIPVKEFEKRLGIQYINHLEFEDADALKLIVKKSQKKLKKSSFDQMNKWNLALYKKAILEPKPHQIYIRFINSYLGYGAFSAQSIPELTYIGEYTGIVKKRKRKTPCLNDYIFRYAIGRESSPFIIDAEKKGNLIRFINHSDEPNLTSRWIIIKGIPHIILFSNQFIPKGKQLTYDYGEDYWRTRSNPDLIT